MSDIPERIKPAAGEANQAAWDILFSNVHNAILAERERCAQIAESFTEAERKEYGANYCEVIAAAIRSKAQ